MPTPITPCSDAMMTSSPGLIFSPARVTCLAKTFLPWETNSAASSLTVTV